MMLALSRGAAPPQRPGCGRARCPRARRALALGSERGSGSAGQDSISLERLVNEMGAMRHSQEANMKRQEANMKRQEANMKRLANKMEHLAEDVVAVKLSVERVEGDVVAVKRSVERVEGDVAAVKLSVERVEGDVVAIKVDGAIIKPTVAYLAATATAVAGAFGMKLLMASP